MRWPPKHEVFHLAWYNTSIDGIGRYLDATEVAKVVQLLQDGTSIRAIAIFALFQHSLKSMAEIPGDKILKPIAGLVLALLCKEEQDEHCRGPTKYPPTDHW